MVGGRECRMLSAEWHTPTLLPPPRFGIAGISTGIGLSLACAVAGLLGCCLWRRSRRRPVAGVIAGPHPSQVARGHASMQV